MAFEEGNTLGQKFTSDNQPPAERKRHGPRRSDIARRILAMRVTVEDATMTELRKSYPELSEVVTGEELATLIQLNKAILFQDTSAYKTLLDSAYGAPIQAVEHTGEDGGPMQIDSKAQSTVVIIDTTDGHKVPAPDEDYNNPDAV